MGSARQWSATSPPVFEIEGEGFWNNFSKRLYICLGRFYKYLRFP
jgi:hypothetical protein